MLQMQQWMRVKDLMDFLSLFRSSSQTRLSLLLLSFPLLLATSDDILLTGVGTDDGDPLLMTSYRSEVGGLAAGFAVLGTLARSGLINIH
jgi:hypothetical protein